MAITPGTAVAISGRRQFLLAAGALAASGLVGPPAEAQSFPPLPPVRQS